MPTTPQIRSVTLKVGMEVHVELSTRTKMFSRAASPAHDERGEASPNALIDPTVLALPGALPVMNREAVEMAMLVGMALHCTIAPRSRWDRKAYFYPDLPKAYQISQYDEPLCEGGWIDVPAPDAQGFPDLSTPATRIRIIRAHLEEDAGKLMHEWPAAEGGARSLDGSIVDYNRAGTPLLEIVTAPDFSSAEQAVMFARLLRTTCRFLGVTRGVMQKGHMRFEPNINCALELADGPTIATPIVEIKNLNSFRSLKGAIEHELAEQPQRFLADGRVHGPGAKSTRGWDDAANRTFVQREKEDAHDYRYIPDPDLPRVAVDDAWRSRVQSRLVELPMERVSRYGREFGIGSREVFLLTEERGACELFEGAVAAAVAMGVEPSRAGRLSANILMQSGAKRANERATALHELGITPESIGAIVKLREDGRLGNQAVDELFVALCEAGAGAASLPHAESIAAARGLLIVRDDGALERWVDQVLAANEKAAADVRAGKMQAVGRLVGEVMKLASGAADAKSAREMILKKLGAG